MLVQDSGTLIGKIEAGTDTYIHNAGFVWLVFLIPLVVLGWFLMNNIRAPHVSPNIGGTVVVVRQDPRDAGGGLRAVADRALHHPARVDRAWAHRRGPSGR